MKRFIVVDEECKASGRQLAELGQPWWRYTSGVLGILGEGNVSITTYPKRVRAKDKAPLALAVGEAVLVEYSLSGGSGLYEIVRIDDGAPPEHDVKEPT